MKQKQAALPQAKEKQQKLPPELGTTSNTKPERKKTGSVRVDCGSGVCQVDWKPESAVR